MTSMKIHRLGLVAGALAALTACPECAPEAVGEGVARLTVRNVGAMLTLLNADDSCGFQSPAVLSSPVIDGEAGGPGTVTFTVNDCTIDLGSSESGTLIAEDCNGVTRRGSGRFTASATRTIAGTLTGDPQNPVVPAAPDALTIRITESSFDDFEVIKSDSEDKLRIIAGSLTAVAKPLLAAAESSGACAIATPNVDFSQIRYGESAVFVTTDTQDFDADVAASDITATNGRIGNEENTISGTMTVFDEEVDVQGDTVLDEDYERGVFEDSYACLEDIAQPTSFECTTFEERLGDGAARLGLQAIGALAGVLDDNTACGFSSLAALQSARLAGAPGGEGTLTITVNDCALDFGAADGPLVTLPADCTGESTTLAGRAVVSGTKVVVGHVTGDPRNPIIPLSAQPVTLTISAEVAGLRVGSTADDTFVIVQSGLLEGAVRPKLFVGADTGVCSVSSPNADFADVAFTNAAFVISSGAGSFDVLVENAALTATNGLTATGENLLAGTVRINGADVAVPNDARGLDPAYEREAFAATYECNEDFAQPLSDTCEDAARVTIGTGVAALTMPTLGAVVSLVDADAACGFSSATVAAGSVIRAGEGDTVVATFTLPAAGCALAFPADTLILTDCLGNTTTVGGEVRVTGTKTITGIATGDPAAPILPSSADAVRYDLDITFRELAVEQSAQLSSLLIHSGALSAVVEPRLALVPATQTCTFATPALTFTDVVWNDAAVALVTAAQTVEVLIDTSSLDAQSGTGLEKSNTLSGSVTVLGDALALDGPLDPAFDAEAFASTWDCPANGSPILVPSDQCLAGLPR